MLNNKDIEETTFKVVRAQTRASYIPTSYIATSKPKKDNHSYTDDDVHVKPLFYEETCKVCKRYFVSLYETQLNNNITNHNKTHEVKKE